MVFDDEVIHESNQESVEESEYGFDDNQGSELSKSSLPGVAFIAPESISSEIQKMNERLGSISDWINQFYSKFSIVCENINGIKSHLAENEEKVSDLGDELRSMKELLNHLNPEKINTDIESIHQRVESFDRDLESTNSFRASISGQINEVKKKVEIYLKNDRTSKLSDRVKKNLEAIKGLGEQVRLAESKSDQAVIGMNNSISEVHKIYSKFGDIKGISAQLREEIEGLKVKNNELEQLKQENAALRELVEKSLIFTKENKERIKDFMIRSSEEKSNKFLDYENQLEVILKMLDNFASSISDIKKKIKNSETVSKSSEFNKKIQNLEFSVLDIQKRLQNARSPAEMSELREKIRSFNLPLVISEFNKKIQNLEFSISSINKGLKDSDLSVHVAEIDNKLAGSDSSLFEIQRKLNWIHNEVRQVSNRVSKLEGNKDSKVFFNQPMKAKSSEGALEVKKIVSGEKPLEKGKGIKIQKDFFSKPNINVVKPQEEKVSFVKRIFGIGGEKKPKPLKSFEMPELPPFVDKKSDLISKKPVLQASQKMERISLPNKKLVTQKRPEISKTTNVSGNLPGTSLDKLGQKKSSKVLDKNSFIKKISEPAKGRKVKKENKKIKKEKGKRLKVKAIPVVKSKKSSSRTLDDIPSLPELPELPEFSTVEQKKSKKRSLK